MIPVYIEQNVSWLPQPNTLEIILTDETAPAELTATAFVVPLFDNDDMLLAQNTRRGVEIPGGHVDPDETFEQAARREAIEEVGVLLNDLHAIGYMRMTCTGAMPEGYRYPFPISYQQFFTARISGQVPCGDYECDEPVRLDDVSGLPKRSIGIFAKRAREVLSAR